MPSSSPSHLRRHRATHPLVSCCWPTVPPLSNHNPAVVKSQSNHHLWNPLSPKTSNPNPNCDHSCLPQTDPIDIVIIASLPPYSLLRDPDLPTATPISPTQICDTQVVDSLWQVYELICKLLVFFWKFLFFFVNFSKKIISKKFFLAFCKLCWQLKIWVLSLTKL